MVGHFNQILRYSSPYRQTIHWFQFPEVRWVKLEKVSSPNTFQRLGWVRLNKEWAWFCVWRGELIVFRTICFKIWLLFRECLVKIVKIMCNSVNCVYDHVYLSVTSILALHLQPRSTRRPSCRRSTTCSRSPRSGSAARLWARFVRSPRSRCWPGTARPRSAPCSSLTTTERSPLERMWWVRYDKCSRQRA